MFDKAVSDVQDAACFVFLAHGFLRGQAPIAPPDMPVSFILRSPCGQGGLRPDPPAPSRQIENDGLTS